VLDEIAIMLMETIKKRLSLAEGEVVIGVPTGEDGIFIDLSEFNVEQFGIGKSSFTKKDEIREFFSGNGEQRNFKLKYKPIKPVKRIEHPIGFPLTEKKDFKISYENGTVTFNKPPEKGDENILVIYYSSEASREIDLYKLKAVYNLKIAYKDPKKTLYMTYKVLEVLLGSIDDFEKAGLKVRILSGKNVEKAKTLPVEIESVIQIEKAVPPIEKISIKGEKIG